MRFFSRIRLVSLPMLLLDVPITSEAEFAFVDALAAAAPRHLSDGTRSRPANPGPDARCTALGTRGSRWSAKDGGSRRHGWHAREASAPALQGPYNSFASTSGSRGPSLFRARREPRMRRDRPTRSRARSKRNPARPDCGPATFARGISCAPRRGVRASGHTGSLRTRRGAARPRRASILFIAEMCR